MNDLQGLLVVSVEQAVAAPYASGRLAAAGARVIKVERPEGDFARRYDRYVNGSSAYFVWLNQGKESIRLDLKSDEDLGVLRRMVSIADIFIQNLVPGAIDRMGFGADTLRRRDPRLITCDISGYGEDGPYRDQKAYDLLVQAESGLATLTGIPESPGRVGVSVCDIAAGMTAYQSILQALIGRGVSGEGRAIKVSLFHAMADWMNVPYLQHVYGGHTPARAGLAHPTIAPYGTYACADGRAILLSIQNEREWTRFCGIALGDPEIATDSRFATNPDRITNRPALDDIINRLFSTLTRDDAIARLEAAGIAYGRLSSLEDVAGHPQNRYRDAIDENGAVRLLASGAQIEGAQPTVLRVPALGEHDTSLRAEFASGDDAA